MNKYIKNKCQHISRCLWLSISFSSLPICTRWRRPSFEPISGHQNLTTLIDLFVIIWWITERVVIKQGKCLIMEAYPWSLYYTGRRIFSFYCTGRKSKFSKSIQQLLKGVRHSKDFDFKQLIEPIIGYNTGH